MCVADKQRHKAQVYDVNSQAYTCIRVLPVQRRKLLLCPLSMLFVLTHLHLMHTQTLYGGMGWGLGVGGVGRHGN